MSSRPARAVACVLVLLMMSLSPLVGVAAADDSILLQTDTQHVVLAPGQSTNVTLTVENNGSSIETYNISIDDGSLAMYWEILPVDDTLDNVFPTWSKNTTVVVRLSEGATVADSGSFTITVTEPDSELNSSITVLVTVAPAYHPSLSGAQNGPVAMAAGASTTLAFNAHNLGTVTDTLLLDVEVEPDLSGWWANQTSNNSNNTNNSGNTTPTTSISVLMYGNSYTNYNNLGSMVESMIDAAGYNGSVTALTGGGMMLSGHWQNVNTSGHQWNTTLRTQTTDYVVLQDQSQVPSLPSNDSYWQESKNASVLLSNEIEHEGAETVLFMTWGRRSGESGNQWHQHNNINQNFTDMQERLAEGYTRYAENISSAGHSVWIAPVGLAYKTVHDAVVADGDDPTVSGNLFYDLYDTDGSHPSLSGSYLASCVLHSTTTGEPCVGSNDNVALSASVKLALQEAADDTVFNQTTGMSYYPWEVSGTSAFGLGASIPAGWLVAWQDDEVPQLAAGGSQPVTLSVTVPTDAVPDYYGYRLTVASTNGNITSSTVLVVDVQAEPAGELAFLRQNDPFLPGESTSTGVQVTNTGNVALDIDWHISSGPSSLCTAALSTPQSLNLQAAAIAEVGVVIDVDEDADSTDTCDFTLTGSHQVGEVTEQLAELTFTVNIDEAVNFSLSGPLNIVDIVPSEGASYELRITNHGSDAAVFFLDIPESTGLDTVLVSASGVSVSAGEIGVWTVNTRGDAALSGLLQQPFSVTYNGQTSTTTVDIHLLEVAAFTLEPPVEDRVLVAPGSFQHMTFELVNTGTANLTLTSSLLGLPVGVSGLLSNDSVVLSLGESVSIVANFSAETGASPSTTSVSLSFSTGELTQTFVFDLIVTDRSDVNVNALQSRLLANPATVTTMMVDVTNLGTQADIFALDWSSSNSGDWFEFTIQPTTFQLSPGSTQQVSVGVREVVQGAPSSGVPYSLTVTSTTDAVVMDSVNVLVEAVVANANLTVLREQSTAKPGETVSGSLLVTNTGNAEDTFSITTVGTDCGLDASVTLAPGLASSPLAWSCVVPSDASAGQDAITFRAVSSIRSNIAVDTAVVFTVEADWPGDSLVALTFEDAQLTFGVDSSTTTVLTVQNLANAEVTGTLDVLGQDTGVLLLEWVRLADGEATSDYALTPGSSVEFKLTVISNTARTATSEVVVRATSTGGGVLTSDQSLPLPVTVEGPVLPPNGLALPLGLSVSQPAAFATMGLGWLIALLAVRQLRRAGSKEDQPLFEDVEEEDDDAEEEEEELGFNECRMDDQNKVNCPTCDARLGVPRGSVAPFRFTCPKCDSKIRVIE